MTPSVDPHLAARVVAEVDPEELPVGRISKLLLELVHDSLGWPIHLPILCARGHKPGPIVGLTAALHGNELNGIAVIHQLFERLDARALRGTVVAVTAVNVPGMMMHQRELNDGSDLNDIMPGRPDGNVAQVYAHRFVKRVLRHFDYLIDLHTASFGRINSLYVRADMVNPNVAQMAYLQRPQIILHNPPSDGTLRGAADELGIPAITVEIGNPHRFQTPYIKRALVGLRAVLGELGMLPRRPVAPGPEPILCSRSRWMYTDHGGLLEVFPDVTQLVQKGEVVARLDNAFGETVREYRAPEDAVVIGKSVNPVGQTGARILHYGVVADASKPPFASREQASGSLRGLQIVLEPPASLREPPTE